MKDKGLGAHPHINRRLDTIIGLLTQLVTSSTNTVRELTHMANELTDLTAAVTDIETVDGSIIQLLTNIKAALDAAIASGDPAALAALTTRLLAQKDAIVAAVAANTPAA